MELFEVLHLAAQCFAPVSEKQWAEATDAAAWSEFVSALDEAAFGDARAAVEGAGNSTACATASRAALSAPPTFAEKERFARRHFTGGLPASAQPVESLYWPPEPGSAGPSYLRDSALYMRDLLGRFGIEVPAAFAATPDHVALELEVAALLAESGDEASARAFLAERLGWLSAYGERLEALGSEAAFYAALAYRLATLADTFRKVQ